MLVATEVTGVETAELARSEVAEEESESEENAEELAREVGELPLEPARPVTVEMVGFDEA